MALSKYQTLTKKFNLKKGYHVTEPNINDVNRKVKEGYDFIGFSWDTFFLGQTCKDNLSKLK